MGRPSVPHTPCHRLTAGRGVRQAVCEETKLAGSDELLWGSEKRLRDAAKMKAEVDQQLNLDAEAKVPRRLCVCPLATWVGAGFWEFEP